MSTLTIDIVESFELRPTDIAQLHELEAQMSYPIADGADHFTIDHGEHYHEFFSDMGETRLMLLREDRRIQGVMVGVWRPIQLGETRIMALYLADLKLSPHLRGKRVVPRMIWHGIRELFRRAELGSWHVVYGAAMRGASGDVMRSMRGSLHPARWLDHQARFHLYFVSRQELEALPQDSPPLCATDHPLAANFSPERRAPCFSTRGKKDFMLASTNSPWNLVHLDEVSQPTTLATTLAAALHHGTQHMRGDDEVACFALDQGRTEQIAWLQHHGISPGATCTLYAMQVRNRWMRPEQPPLHALSTTYLSTSTI